MSAERLVALGVGSALIALFLGAIVAVLVHEMGAREAVRGIGLVVALVAVLVGASLLLAYGVQGDLS